MEQHAVSTGSDLVKNADAYRPTASASYSEVIARAPAQNRDEARFSPTE